MCGVLRGLLAAGVVALAVQGAGAQITRRPFIVNGTLTVSYPSVGVLLFGSDSRTASLECSGTLIGCQTFLTAGHCVADDLNPANYLVFLQHAGFFSVSRIALHPDFDFPVGDVAVLTLAQPVNGIAPSRIDTTAEPAPGMRGTIVGFGRTGGGDNNVDYGLKRAGQVEVAECNSDIASATSVCWDFTSPFGPPGSNSNTCEGDSGGPLFVDFGAGNVVAGTTSGGNTDSCFATDEGYDASIFTYREWIAMQAGADLARTTCGALPQVGGAHTTVLSDTGALDGINSQRRLPFTVPAGTTAVRVAMNAIDDDHSNFDLYVKANGSVSPRHYDCRAAGPSQYGFCAFDAPVPGVWEALVIRGAGSGLYQLTITFFALDCALPGNEGRDCDDHNPCTQNDACHSGACSGTAATDGTACDDGNQCTQSDGCRNGTCVGSAQPDGTACDDGDPCSQPDACRAGLCLGTSPASGCKQQLVQAAGAFNLRDAAPDLKDRLTWRWLRGARTVKRQFGTPTIPGNDYALCVYDHVGGVPERIMQHVMPGGDDWSEYLRGFRYADENLSNSGIGSVTLKEGADGSARIEVQGRARALNMPALPLQQKNSVTVQLLNRNACWESRYSTALENDAHVFKAKND